tara:strand:+ start:3394 stop:4416 length:1023 start_codon:yes stop_codon:yes gene_type:complete
MIFNFQIFLKLFFFSESFFAIAITLQPNIKCTYKGKKPQVILFEGGGTLGIVYAGVAKRLEEKGLLSNINKFAGTSVGAHAASLLAFGFTGNELIGAITNMPLENFLDGKPGIIRRIFSLIKNYGYYNGKNIETYLEDLFISKYGIEKCTMQQLYELTGNELRVGVCNVINRKYEMIDRHNHPNIPVSVACRASSTIPLFFQPVYWEDKMFVDGALNANLPADAFPNVPALACNLVSARESGADATAKPTNIIQYIRAIINIIFYAAQEKHGRIIEGGDTDTIDIIYPNDIGSYDFYISEKQKKELIKIGEIAVDKYLSLTFKSNSTRNMELDFWESIPI